MRIVIGCDTENPYVDQLAQSLSSHSEVEQATESLYSFWHGPDSADILHIQWPEGLFNWENSQPWEVARLARVLDEWSSEVPIVTTVHNYKPHNLEDCERLYRLVYQASDGIVHLGKASRDWFFDQYSFASKKEHTIIPHGNYSCFLDQVSDIEARKRLDLGTAEFVCLCFGEIRKHQERNLLVNAFKSLGGWRKRLVIAGGGSIPSPSTRTLQYWRLAGDPRIRTYDGWIPDEEVQLFFRAADVLVIPREGVLNSGNVALGFTFGRTVVGPNEGVIGEVLRKTNNPVYEPGDAQALADELEAVRDSDGRRGEKNKAYAMEEMHWEKVASCHVDLYRQVLK